ncbi:MAG: hypothetical protein ACQET8_19305 [Bacillota bacterium]
MMILKGFIEGESLSNTLKIIAILLASLLLSSCDLVDLMDIKGEKVWVTVYNEHDKIIKSNTITKNDKKLEIYTIMDFYNKKGDYLSTYIFLTAGEKERAMEEHKPLTLLTDRLKGEMSLNMNKEEKLRVKQHVLEQMKKLDN